MANLADILQQERDRDTVDKWGIIHLYKTGSFYSAYEWSAWLIAVITFNDQVRMQTKDRKPIAVTHIPMANSDDTFCRVGFPLKSIEKYIPTRLNYEAEDDKHLVDAIISHARNCSTTSMSPSTMPHDISTKWLTCRNTR